NASLRWRLLTSWRTNLWAKMKQEVPENTFLQEDPVEDTPLWDLLTVLGLHDPDHIAGAATIDTQAPSANLTVKKIRLTASADDPMPLEGISALRQYVGQTDAFELLYHEGRLMAVVPILSAPGSRKQVPYLDLSAYSAKVPTLGEANSSAAWQALAARQRRDQRLIRDHLRAVFPTVRYH